MNASSLIHPESMTLSSNQLALLNPYFVVFGGAVLALILSVIRIVSPKWPVFLVVVATCVLGILSSLGVLNEPSTALLNNRMVSDQYSHFFNMIFLASAGLTALISFRYLDREKLQHPEYYVLLLFSTIGMMLMASALDLIGVFIGLELMSITVYVLVGFRRADRRCNEAAIKYFILGSAASAVLLYGIALLYGATGSLNIAEILKFVRSNASQVSPLFSLGGWLVLIGFLFKVAVVPFHMWLPDVYEGAPTPITGFMTTGIKAAAFATLVRVFVCLGYDSPQTGSAYVHMHSILWVLAVLTMLIGNVIALTQINLKRMLAYSSIAHSGYLLVGILAGGASDQGFAPVVMYLATYTVMNLGAFGVLALLSTREDTGLCLQDLAGLSRQRPWMAFALAVFLMSMAGIPPTAGFAAKYNLFYSAVQAGEVWLVVLAVLCSAISVYYYLRVLVYMYMRDPVGSAPATRVSVWAAAVVAAMVAVTLQVGMLPDRMVTAAKRAVTSL